MKRYFYWLQTEYKRAAVWLPAILIKAVILAAFAGVIAFCGQKMLTGDGQAVVKIGYAAPEDRVTSLAVAFIENMESVKSWCELVSVEEEEGLKLLKNGELAALLVLPENVVDGIMTGSNEPAGLYLAETTSPYGLVFEELAKAGVGMLKTAQAEIYAAGVLTEQFDCGQAELSRVYEEIDRFNLGIAMAREQYFKVRTVSATGNRSEAVYYGSALFTLYLLMGSLFLGRYVRQNSVEQRMLVKRRALSGAGLLAGRALVTVGLLFLILLPPFGVLLFLQRQVGIGVVFSAGGVCLLLLSLCFLALWTLFLGLCTSHQGTLLLWGGLSAILYGYFAGCFVPTPLLPWIVEKIAECLPVTYMKEGFAQLFSGSGTVDKGMVVLIIWSILLFLLCVMLQQYRMRRLTVDDGKTKRMRTRFATSVIGILTKRLLRKKSFLVCMALMLLTSVVTVKLEKQSETRITAAVATSDETWRRVLSAYEGLVQFVLCDSEDEVKRNVLQKNAECGYVLQEDLQNEIAGGNGSWAITVYESADSTLTRMVNEVIFERLFYVISSGWYEGYIAEKDCFAEVLQEVGEESLRGAAATALQDKMQDGSTFTFHTLSVESTEKEEKTEKEASFYPVFLLVCACILFCAGIGTMDACGDKKAGRLRRKSRFYTIATVAIPVGFGLVTGLATLLLCGAAKNIWQVSGGILFALFVTAAGVCIQWWYGKK